MSYPIASIISRARNSSLSSANQTWAGFLLCDGSTYLKSDYEDLYTEFSDNSINTDTNGYGVSSSDSTKFLVPNLSDYTPCMVNSQNTSGQLGETSGNLSKSINKYLLPTHNHSFSLSNSHTHSFTYKGFNQGYNSSSEELGAGNDEYDAINYNGYIIPESLGNISFQEVTYQVGQSGTTSSSTINLDIINSYVGVDYYIKY
jgi:microcystin-dependent protein